MSDFNIEFEENDQQITLEFESGVGGAVSSVNGMTGDVVLDAEDVGAYVKPSGGIPKTDLASAVQTSLGKADSAYQKPSGGIPANDIASGVVPAVDNTLAVSGAAADAKKTGDEIATVKDGFDDLDDRVTALEQGGTGGGLTDDIKQALLQIAEKVVYVDAHGQDYYDALEDALYPPADLVRISCVYTQSGTVYNTDTLDSLKTDLVVTAHMSDSTTRTVTAYTLSGTLAVGTSTITVAYGGKTTTFSVTVTEAPPAPPITPVLYRQSVESGGTTGWYARFYPSSYKYFGFWAEVEPNTDYLVTVTGIHFNRFRVQMNNTFDPENISYQADPTLYPLDQIYSAPTQPTDKATEQTVSTTVNSGNYHWMTVQVRSGIESSDELICTIEEV